MFHYFSTLTDDKGNSLPQYQIEVVQLADGQTVVPIFSDENGTPISAVSGIDNRALSDAAGNYDFFVENGIYSLRFYDSEGGFLKTQRYLSFFGAANPISSRTVTSDSDAFVFSDAFGAVNYESASAVSVTVPTQSAVPFLDETTIELRQLGAGQITVSGDTGVTVNSLDASNVTSGQFALAALRKVGADNWLLTGDLASGTPPGPPVFTQDPAISGTVQVGQTLTATDGVFSGGSVTDREWIVNGSVVATGSSYTVATADGGYLIEFRVTLSGPGGTATGTSPSVGPVPSFETLKYGSARFPLANGDDINGVNGGLFLPNAQDLTEVNAAGDLPLLGQDGAVAVIWDLPRAIYRGAKRRPVLLGNDRMSSATANRQFRLGYVSEAENGAALTADGGKFQLIMRDNLSNEWEVFSAFWPESFSDKVMVIVRRESNNISIDLLDVATGTYLSGPSSSLPSGFEGIKLITNSLGIGAFRQSQFPQDAANGLFTNGVGYARGSCGGVLMIEEAGTQSEWQSFAAGADPLSEWSGSVRAWFPLADSSGSIDLGFNTNLTSPTAYNSDLVIEGTVVAGSTIRGQGGPTEYLRVVNLPDPCVVGTDYSTGIGTLPIRLNVEGMTAGDDVEARVIRKSDGFVTKNWHSIGTTIENGTFTVSLSLEAAGTFAIEIRIGSVVAYVNSDIVCGAAHLMNGQSQCIYTFSREINENDNVTTTRTQTFDTGVGERTYVMALAPIPTSGGYTPLPAMYYAPTTKMLTDGIIAAANKLAEDYPAGHPIIILDVSVAGTTISDTLTNGGSRNMGDIYAITDLLRGRDSQDRAIITIWHQFWHSSGSVQQYAQAFMPPLLNGTTTTQVPVIDDYPRSGTAGGVNPGFDFVHYEPNRIIASVPISPTNQDTRTEHLTRKNLRDEEGNYDYTLGAPLDVHRLENDVFTHPDDTGSEAALGAVLTAQAVASSALRSLNLGGYVGPVYATSADIDSGDASRIVVTFTGPSGFALGTITNGATVSGFEVDNDRTGFTPSIDGQTVVLTKTSGTWTAGASVELKPGGPGNYGGSISEADFVAGGIINTDHNCQVRGTGLPLAAS